MPKTTSTISDVKVIEWSESVGTALVGLTVMAASMLLFYSTKFGWIQGGPRFFARVGFGMATFAGAGIIAFAIVRSLEARRTVGVSFPCPYCDIDNHFPAIPTTDFDCEFCNRTVHFVDEKPIQVRTVICQACKAEHRVPANLDRYVCDKCNRPLKVAHDPKQRIAAPSGTNDAMLANYNVVVLAFDRRKENELAFKIGSLMVVNLPDARKHLATATPSTPLVVANDVPQRKAEAIRRQLQDLGATAAIKPSGFNVPVGTQARGR